MSRVATAENMIEEVRWESLSNFDGLVSAYADSTRGEMDAIGTQTGKNSVSMQIPLIESEVPGTIDLDGNGKTDTVTNGEARLLVLDLGGSDSLRLRTIVHDTSKLNGIWWDKTAQTTGTPPVTYGEVRTSETQSQTTQTTETTETTTTTTTEPPVSGDVVVDTTSWNGDGLDLVVTTSAGAQKVVAIGVVPDAADVYTNNITFGGKVVYTFTGEQKSGMIKVKLSPQPSLNGQTMVRFDNFQKWDKTLHQWVNHRPGFVTVTLYLGDGTTTTTYIRN